MAVVDEAFCFVSLLRTDLQRTMEKALASERAGSGEFDLTSDASLGRLLQQRRGDTCTSLLEYQMQDICLRLRYKCTSTSASIAISM
jgi:hypothetical protein